MRWPWTRGEAPDRIADLRDTVDAIDTVDPDTLEIVELDDEGRPVGLPGRPAHESPHELAEHPSRRDPTGTAGIWEALSHS